MSINSVENVNVTTSKQKNTQSSSAAKKAAKLYQSLHNKGNNKVLGSPKVDSIEISEEGKALAASLISKKSTSNKT